MVRVIVHPWQGAGKAPGGIKAVAVVPRGVLGGIANGVVGVAAGLGTGGPLGRCAEALRGMDFGTLGVVVPTGPAGSTGAPEAMAVLVAPGLDMLVRPLTRTRV